MDNRKQFSCPDISFKTKCRKYSRKLDFILAVNYLNFLFEVLFIMRTVSTARLYKQLELTKY